jgi:TRAP-type C4-dicarboxylate transport system permease small subunit
MPAVSTAGFSLKIGGGMEKKKYYLDELIGAVLLGIMSIITFANVMNRYFFKHSIAFTEEITVNLFVWITLLGISMAFRRGANLKMTNIFDKFSPKLKKTAIIAAGILGTALFLFITINSVREIYKNITFYKSISEALGIPTWIYSLGTPIFSLFVIVQLILSTRDQLKQAKLEKER